MLHDVKCNALKGKKIMHDTQHIKRKKTLKTLKKNMSKINIIREIHTAIRKTFCFIELLEGKIPR